MTYEDILNQAVAMLQRQKCLTYESLQLQFHLDDAHLKVLKNQLLYAHPQTVSDDGQGLVWTGDSPDEAQNAQSETDREIRFQALLKAVMWQLQCDERVTYRTLKHILGLDDALRDAIREELTFRRLAVDENGQGLVWIGETQSGAPPGVDALSHSMPTAGASSKLPTPAPETGLPSNEPPGSAETLTIDVEPNELTVTSTPIRSSPEAERRQLTVMFCDLVGSTDLSGKLDPEDLREVVRAYQSAASKVIERYEGHIAQYLGDGLLIYFGFPLAHEDDAQRAVHSALEMPEAISNLNTCLAADYGVQLAVRIGIHTGPVVVGEMGGEGRQENLALGETPNIAARLEGLALANTMVISPVTAQLVQRSFIIKELGLHELRGVAEPMMLYTVIAPDESEHDDHETMLSGGFEALVGRDEEIGLLLRRWEQSKDGQGQVVLISGEAGLGKSSLVEGLRAHVRQEGYTRIAFRCSPYTGNSAMHPVIEHAQRVLGWERDDSAETKLDKLEQAIKPTNLPVEETVPLLAALLSLIVPEDRYPALMLSPQRQRQLTQDALVAWMLEEAERQPVLAVWEDIHWADPSTLELLSLFIEQVPTVPMLNILTYRPEFVLPWSMQSHMTPITLNRLERTHIETLVRRLARGKQLPKEVETHIVAKTDGVPLYVEELTKMLLESELLAEENDQYTLTGSLSRTSIPATLQDSLMARLDSLPSLKEVAQLGAVLGREFDYEMLQALNAIDEPTLQRGLSQLVAHDLLYQRGRIPRAKYIFRHVLIRDAAYQSLLRRTRQQYHKRVAQLLEEQFSEVVEIQPELVAYHYSEAGLNEQSVGYWHKAGHRAAQRFAHLEAIDSLTKGLALLATLPDTPARLQQELDLQVVLGPALLATKGMSAPELERAYARAWELCQQLGDTTEVFPVLRGLILYYYAQGQLQEAHRLGEQLLCLAQLQSKPELLLLAHHMLGLVLFWHGEPAAAYTHHTHALTLYNVQEHRSLAVRYGIDLGVTSISHAALELWYLGYPAQALQHGQAALKLARELSHHFSLVFALLWMTSLHQFRREASVSQEQAEAATNLASEQGFVQWLAWGTALHGWSLAMQGQGEAGIAELNQGLAADLATGTKAMQSYFLCLLAEAHGESGFPDEGLHLLAEATVVMDTVEVRFYGAEIHRLKGQLLLQQSSDNHSEAECCFQQALSIAQNQQAKSLELRAATSLARLWQSQGKRQDAYDLLAPVYEWFTEGFDTADLKDAKTLLDEMKG